MVVPFTRRQALGWAVGAAGAATVAGINSAAGAAHAGSEPTQRVVLTIARAGAQFPLPFPSFGEAGSARSRATMERFETALASLSPGDAGRVTSGAAMLAAQVDWRTQRTILRDLARAYHHGGADQRKLIEPVVATAVATVSKRFSADNQAPARLWLAGLVGSPEGLGLRGEVHLAPNAS